MKSIYNFNEWKINEQSDVSLPMSNSVSDQFLKMERALGQTQSTKHLLKTEIWDGNTLNSLTDIYHLNQFTTDEARAIVDALWRFKKLVNDSYKSEQNHTDGHVQAPTSTLTDLINVITHNFSL